MEKTGTLQISGGNSRLDGTLLAKNSDPEDPLAEATRFLRFERGLKDGNLITVTGSEGTLDPGSDVTVIFISDAQLATEALEAVAASKKKATGGKTKAGASRKTKRGSTATTRSAAKKPKKSHRR